MHGSFLASAAAAAAASVALATESASEHWIVPQVSKLWLEDIDCDVVRSSLVDWKSLRSQVNTFDLAWPAGGPPPSSLCKPQPLGGKRALAGELAAVLRLPQEAAAECPWGALAASAVALVCESDCGAGAAGLSLERLWRRLLARRSAPRPEVASELRAEVPPPWGGGGPAYLLSTSSWSIASLLTKWASNCSLRPSPRLRTQPCSAAAAAFLGELGDAASRFLAPLLPGPGGSGALIFDGRLDYFAMAALPMLGRLNRRLPPVRPEWQDARCVLEASTREALVLYIRLLGPNVPRQEVDPLGARRLTELGSLLARLSARTLLRRGLSLLAMVTAFRLMTWRSHRLYPAAQVDLADVRSALDMGARVIQQQAAAAGQAGNRTRLIGALRDSPPLRHSVWQAVVDSSNHASGSIGPALGSVWQRLAKWLLEAPLDVANVVYLTMFWGDMGSDRWVSGFLRRALAIGLPRLVFVSPHETWLMDCEGVAAEDQDQRDGAYRRLLCVRSFAPFARPYDVNNYAKFVLLPLLLSLGVDYAWLDMDIFLIRDPTARFLELAYGTSNNADGQGGADVLTTDHFDEACLNHGVIFVKASDRTLLWALRYIEWMHVYPFGHDQNGWDAFLAHSIRNEPFVPEAANISLRVLDTSLEFLTLTGWAGTDADLPKAQLLHMTRTTPIDTREKRSRLIALFDAAATGDLQMESAAIAEALRGIQTSAPQWKRPCYEGVHVAVESMVADGSYWGLFE